ncbi:tRNA uridine-5-carboxymethylaminomethyl(34) synthesis GTPase MnmE [Nitrosomonas sp.]|uniref:tRNA uridine-5-carboxymethylaminomethyl(34) synthesis GTPase MnmE n=1 Tax=Nitrosomonas sp. TaxID=42353 RepID=UPI001D1BFED4|nr:tRNA uridine-5-carboxymethylaminomethyl(34) synthesis GTPase MnmE [Nitrosomonas sp.]MCB1948494.1 tRNA uridine-5-carboxymethylaminomethyl(34) synthesis GTPase MnmE [Nitrosomonas sp.]
MLKQPDIIAAIATPPGKGGVGIVRISGKNLAPIAKTILGGLPTPRLAQLTNFSDAQGEIIDQGLVLYFPAPHSYTGEDVLELQGHGGPAIMNLLLGACLACGARMAQPGEFTLRAFLNQKLDLVQAESVADIIEASTSQAARCAVRSLQGRFSETIEGLVQSLISLRMLIEATLDFPEEEIEGMHNAAVNNQLSAIKTQLDDVLSSAHQGHLLQEGIKAVLVGEPNVGKSSLLNQLAEDDVAIVTEIPGTTRDSIQKTITLAGIPVHIIDTAGLRETSDIVERKGIERTQVAIKNADLLIRLTDLSRDAADDTNEALQAFSMDKPHINVFNKIDLVDQVPKVETHENTVNVYLSAKTGAGVELLREQILHAAGWQTGQAGEGLFMARQRHLEALEHTRTHLNRASEHSKNETEWVLLAEELRLAQDALSSITGRFTADDLLGEIFSRFCIGK